MKEPLRLCMGVGGGRAGRLRRGGGWVVLWAGGYGSPNAAQHQLSLPTPTPTTPFPPAHLTLPGSVGS